MRGDLQQRLRRQLDGEARRAAEVRKVQHAEDRRFFDRLEFDCRFWRVEREPKSMPGSIWPAIEEACRLWGIGRLPREEYRSGGRLFK